MRFIKKTIRISKMFSFQLRLWLFPIGVGNGSAPNKNYMQLLLPLCLVLKGY